MVDDLAVIYQGDTTTSAGTVLEGSAGYVENGNKLALKGHAVFCPACDGTGIIAEGSDGITVDDIPVALHGHRVDCGCPPGSVTLVALRSAT